MKLIIGDGSAQRIAEWEMKHARDCAAVAEGQCPEHLTRLHELELDGVRLGGHCSPCGKYWWYDTRLGEIGSESDHDPVTGTWRPPRRDRYEP